ncbi:hypothetical protein DV738_g187, partial [Chaetothyriales sp. CBS 135597]
MSKEKEQEDHANDRVPSYEESIAHQGVMPSPSLEKSPRLSIQQRNRLKRARLINDLICSQVEPVISGRLEDGIGATVAILVPSDALSPSTVISTSNITSPALASNTSLLRLRDDDYKSSFLLQPAVINDLASALTASLVDPAQLQVYTSALPNPQPMEPLPARPQPDQRNTLRYMAGIAEPDKDPTGSTGSWNLGWRDENDPAETNAATVRTDELTVSTRVQDVTLRLESDMGLLEMRSLSSTVAVVEMSSSPAVVVEMSSSPAAVVEMSSSDDVVGRAVLEKLKLESVVVMPEPEPEQPTDVEPWS